MSSRPFGCGPQRLLDMAAVGLARMQSTTDAKLYWKIDPNPRHGGDIWSIHALCPLVVQWGQSNAREGWSPEPIQTTLGLLYSAIPAQIKGATAYHLEFQFQLGANPSIDVRSSSFEYHILASCAFVASYLVEARMLANQELEGFWRLTAGAWQEREIRQPTATDLASLLLRLRPFGLGEVPNEGMVPALEIRNWVTGSVKWCDLTTQIMFRLPASQAAHALLTRGIQRYEAGDHAGAFRDYTDVTELASATPDLVAHALFRRGIIKINGGDHNGAIADYQALMTVPNAPAELTQAADRQLVQWVATAYQTTQRREP